MPRERMGYAVFILVMIVCIGLGVWRFMRRAGQVLIVRIIDALLPFSVAGLILLTVSKIAEGPSNPWNECKLAPVVAMTRGYALYQDQNTGVMCAWPYGPIGGLMMLPSAMASDPTTCVIIGLSIATLCYITPLIWLLVEQADVRTRPMAWALIVLIGWITGTHEDLARCALIAGPDGPVVFFGAVACAAILHRRTVLWMSISALSAVLCCWTKQNFLPLLPALVAWMAIADGRRKALIYSGLLAGIGAIVSILLLASFGASNMYFQMISIPAHQPFLLPVGGGIVELFGVFAMSLALLLLVLIGDAILSRRAAQVSVVGSKWKQLQNWIAERNWTLPLLVSIAMVPTSVLGFVKVGGFVNHMACTDYFLMAGAAMGAIDVVNRATNRFPDAAPIGSAIFTLFGFCVALETMLVPYNIVSARWAELGNTYDTSEEALYQFSQKHPDEIYCPWNTLITLYTDGKLYHFEWGLLDRKYANIPFDEKQFKDHLPHRMQYLIYTMSPQDHYAFDLLTDYRLQITLPELKDCLVITKTPKSQS